MSRSNKIRECVHLVRLAFAMFVMKFLSITYYVTSTIYDSIINLIYNRIPLDCDVDVRERLEGVDFTDKELEDDAVGRLIIELNRMRISSNKQTEDNYPKTNDNSFNVVSVFIKYAKHFEPFVTHIRIVCSVYMVVTIFCILCDFANHYEQLFYKITQSN